MSMAEQLSVSSVSGESVRWTARKERVDISGLVMTPLHSYLDQRQPAFEADTRPADLIGSVLRCITTQELPIGEPVWTTLSRSSSGGRKRTLQLGLAGRVLRSSEIEGLPGCFLVQVQLDPSYREAVEDIRDHQQARG